MAQSSDKTPSIDEQLERLRSDISTLSDTVRKLATDRVNEEGARVRAKAGETVKRTREQIDGAAVQARDTMERHPVATLAAAFGLGLLAGMWSRR